MAQPQDIMRSLLPPLPAAVDLCDAYALPASVPGHPFVRVNMISSLDGAISISGRSGALGGPADHRVFHTLRALTDVVLVGAGTMRTEGYGPVRLSEAEQIQRQARGQHPVPPIAVVTRSCHLDWTSPFFTQAQARPLVLTTRDSHDHARASCAAEVIVCGDTQVDMAIAVRELAARGANSVLVEGGPGLNAQLVGTGLLDELCLTLSPRLVAGTGPRVLAGPELLQALTVEVRHILEEDSFLFLRLKTGTDHHRDNVNIAPTEERTPG
jgi:riboflavin-specific deaminase-like protein